MADEMTNPGGMWEKILEFLTDFEKMFPKFGETVSKAQLPFFMIALVILVYALVKKLTGAGSVTGYLKATYGVLVITAMVCLCNPLLKLTDGMMKDLGTQMTGGTDTQKSIEEKQNSLVSYLVNDIPNTGSDTGSGEEHGALYYMFHWGDAVENGVDQLVPSFVAFEIKAACGLLIFCSKLASIVEWGFWLLQQFLVGFSMIFLPTFIAMLAVPSLAPNATKYIMGLLGFMAWPIGFGLVNVGTIALIEAVYTHLRNSAATLDATTYVWALIVACAIPVWMIVGSFVAPYAIQRMVAAGGNAAAGMMGQVGAAAVGGAALAATAGAAAVAGPAAIGGVAPGGGGASASGGTSGGSGTDAASDGSSGGGGSGGSLEVGRNPQTLASQRIAGGSGGTSLGGSSAPPPANNDNADSSASSGTAGSSAMSGTSGGGRAGTTGAVIAGAASVAAQPFNALAADSGAPSSYEPTMAERIQRSQASGVSAPVAPPNMTPSSAIAREAVALRRAQNA